jgi:hypothetical protein
VPYAAGQAAGLVQEQAKSMRGKAQQEFNRNNETGGNTIYNDAAALEQARDLLAPREELFTAGKGKRPFAGDEGPSVTYHLRSKHTIPSRASTRFRRATRSRSLRWPSWR